MARFLHHDPSLALLDGLHVASNLGFDSLILVWAASAELVVL